MRSREEKLAAYSRASKRGARNRKRMLEMKEPGLGESQAPDLGMFDRAPARAGSENAKQKERQCTANLEQSAHSVNRLIHLLS